MKNEKKSLNPIPLSMRGKKRYVSFELLSDTKLEETDLSFALWHVFLKLFGEIGTAKQRLWLAKWSKTKNQGILRCSHDSVEEVKAGLIYLKKVKENKVIPRILGISGSIKKLKEK